jgi:hypothetical protein
MAFAVFPALAYQMQWQAQNQQGKPAYMAWYVENGFQLVQAVRAPDVAAGSEWTFFLQKGAELVRCFDGWRARACERLVAPFEAKEPRTCRGSPREAC